MANFDNIIPVILSGGSGTRLWPVSRKHYPKQFIPLRDKRSLFQDTVKRVNMLNHGIQAPIVICNDEHRFMAAEQMRLENVNNANIILEPVGRNTAPAIALAAMCALQRDENSVLLVLPADHILNDQDKFGQAVEAAAGLAAENKLVTFGISPTRPETGYGYIQAGEMIKDGNAHQVASFVEKPDLAKAQEYCDSGNYYWNSGMFIFKASEYLNELARFEPEMTTCVKSAYGSQEKDLDFIRIDKEEFASCKNESIDYAVMERTQNAVVVPLSCDWNDVGSWHALWESLSHDQNNNAVTGDVMLDNCEGCLVHSSNRLIAAVGLKDTVIVETADAIMVAPHDQSQNIKQIVNRLSQAERDEAEIHTKVYRPWGNYESIDSAERFQVKRITVKPGERLSLQKHHHRAEHWIVVKGTALVTCGEKEFLLSENESTYIPIGEVHRLENPGKIALELIEVQSGTYLGEDDIERFDDKYGRSEK
jgi:mannose-1-phosphate guanylyltransferase/mannose-6-phosphate isomerase